LPGVQRHDEPPLAGDRSDPRAAAQRKSIGGMA